jgi:hypothetical protein
MTAIRAFFGDPAGQAIYAMLALAFADFGLGVAAAVRDGTFDLELVAAFVRKHLAGRIAPIALLLFVGYAADLNALTAAGIAASAAYVAETIASLVSSVKSVAGKEQANPVPKA